MDLKLHQSLSYCVSAPLPDTKTVSTIRHNMRQYKFGGKHKKKIVAIYVFNKSKTHILINLNRETICLPDIYGFGGKWGVPKGKQEPYDTCDKDTAIRELFEETGYKVKPEQLKHCYSKLKNTKTFTALLDDAYMDNLTTEFPEYEKEIQSVAWIPLEYLGNILPRDNCNTTLKPLIDNQYIMNKLLQNN